MTKENETKKCLFSFGISSSVLCQLEAGHTCKHHYEWPSGGTVDWPTKEMLEAIRYEK